MIALLARTRLVRPPEYHTDSVYPPPSMTAAQVCFVALLFGLVPAANAADVTGKIDRDIGSSGRKTYAVFVRMADQLLGGRGLYERFCVEHAGAKRRELGPAIVRTLRAKADRSWGRVATRVAELEKSRKVRDLDRYWIVNGFTCDATGDACQRLAALEEVAFVYLQRGPLLILRTYGEPSGRDTGHRNSRPERLAIQESGRLGSFLPSLPNRRGIALRCVSFNVFSWFL